MRFLNIVFVLFSVLTFCPSTKAQLQVPPDIQWKTLETPHFTVIVDERQMELGQLYAKKLERAYFDLSIFFKQFPNKRTILVINDKTDITNGYATPLPYSHIMAFPVLPGPDNSLSDTHDWAYELLVHEYTHILTFEAHRGIMKPLKAIFGNIIAPNSLMPNWWKEGAAVQTESYLSSGGRLKSFYQDATLRGLVDKNRLKNFDIAQANEYIYTWPQGSRPYLFGSLYWGEVVAEFTPAVMGQLHEQQGGRAPYFIEKPSRELTGGNYNDLYTKALNETEARAQKQLLEIKKQEVSDFIFPKNRFLSMISPVVSPNGMHLAFIADGDNHSRSLQLLTKSKKEGSFMDAPFASTVDSFDESFTPGEFQDTPTSGSLQRVAWFPDSQKIVYDKIGYSNRIQRFSDLYIYEHSSKKTTRLTTNLRAREPSVSPNSQNVAFIKLEGGKTSLGLINIATKKTQLLFEAPLQYRLSYPSFIDDEQIIYSLRDTKGNETLETYNLTNKTRYSILKDYSTARFPTYRDGTLFFVSAKSGVLNLYKSVAPFETATALTNTTTAIFTHTVDPLNKEIIASMMTETGVKIGVLPANRQKNYTDLPKIEKLFADRYPSENPSKFDEASVQPTISDYSPYGYLLPRYWIPFMSVASSDTGLSFQASTSGQDPLEKHKYSLLAGYDTLVEKGTFVGTYINHTTEVPFLISSYDHNYFLASKDNVVHERGTQISLLPDLFDENIYETFQFGGIYQERTLTSSSRRMGAFALFNYSNYSQAGAEISPESGYSYYGGMYYFLKKEGYFDHHQYIGGMNLYMKGFARHHAINLRLDGVHIPEQRLPSFYGSSTSSMPFTWDPMGQRLLLRGYKQGQILGKNIAVMNAEYRLPLKDLYRGAGTDPYFLRRLSGALTVDGASADGLFYNTSDAATTAFNRVNFGKDQFWSIGAELKLETTLGYIAPVTFVMGYYYGFQAEEDAKGVIASALQISGF